MSLLRSLIVGGMAVAIARFLCALLADRRAPARRIAWVLLLAPYFTPVLLTGYAYANFSLSLIHHPEVNTVFYAALLWGKFTPIAAVILYFAPPPISAEAIHCHRLMGFQRQRSVVTLPDYSTLQAKFNDWKFLFRAGCARGPIAAFAVVFLCAFAEFEMASLMGVKSWTVTVFDANAGGLAVTESLRRMLGPLLCEFAAVATTVAVLGRHRLNPARRLVAGQTTHGLAWLYLGSAFVFVLTIPAGMVLWGTIRGFGLLFENFVLTREIVSSLLFATGATLLATVAVLWLSPAPWTRRRGSGLRRALLLIAVCLGLLGPLVLSLAVLAVVQLPGLLSLRDTPVTLVLTLALVLLPLALVLKRVLELTGYRSALHLANLLPRSRVSQDLKWQLSTRGKFWAVVLLFVWVYWDLTASSILAPIGMTPVTVRLYNMMHYGQIAALSAMTCATFAVPIFIFLLAFGTRRWWAPR
jgi:ABC-type Fe3+ transport system permease subunit